MKVNFFFIFFSKFCVACRKNETSQGIWYQRVGGDVLFRNSPPQTCITIDVLVLPIFPKFSGRPPKKIRASLGKILYFGGPR